MVSERRESILCHFVVCVSHQTTNHQRPGCHLSGDVVLIKTLLYTGVRVAELVAIRMVEVDLDACRIWITLGKGAKDRVVPFPHTFRETLALHIADRRKTGGAYLFESSWKKPYSTRGPHPALQRATPAGNHSRPTAGPL